jgi:hypothetical protein
MSGLLRFSKVPESTGPASRLWGMPKTPFALMQRCQSANWGLERWICREPASRGESGLPVKRWD